MMKRQEEVGVRRYACVDSADIVASYVLVVFALLLVSAAIAVQALHDLSAFDDQRECAVGGGEVVEIRGTHGWFCDQRPWIDQD